MEPPRLRLGELRPNDGAKKAQRRVGRGPGSGRGKTSGRGHKGQKARQGGSVRLGFEGGQTPMHRRIPKKGRSWPNRTVLEPLGLTKLQRWIDTGRIDPAEKITMKTLVATGAVGHIQDGVKLLADERATESQEHQLAQPINIEVTRCSKGAAKAVLQSGGSLTLVHYNKLGLRALLRPERWERKNLPLPAHARPPPRLQAFYHQRNEANLPIRRIENPEEVGLLEHLPRANILHARRIERHVIHQIQVRPTAGSSSP